MIGLEIEIGWRLLGLLIFVTLIVATMMRGDRDD